MEAMQATAVAIAGGTVVIATMRRRDAAGLMLVSRPIQPDLEELSQV
jgi:hypothetical protein